MFSDLTIDPEFASLCPLLTPEEAEILEKRLLEDGCRDEIVVWAGHGSAILDGHNRYRLCEKHGIPFRIKSISLESREAAVSWILANQLGRRNLTDEQRSYLRGKRYELEKKASSNPTGKNTSEVDAQNGHQPTTAERLAREYSVGHNTIRRDADFAAAVDAIGKTVGADAKQAILSGELKTAKRNVMIIAKLPESEQKQALARRPERVKPQTVKTEPPRQKFLLDLIDEAYKNVACLAKTVDELATVMAHEDLRARCDHHLGQIQRALDQSVPQP